MQQAEPSLILVLDLVPDFAIMRMVEEKLAHFEDQGSLPHRSAD